MDDEKEYCLENKQLNNGIFNDSESCKLSEIYDEFENLILLHSVSRCGGLDRIERDINTRINYINNARISASLICLGKPFDYLANVGVILKDANVIAVFHGDGGVDDMINSVKQMKREDILSEVDKIFKSDIEKQYSELFVTNVVLHGFYYIKFPKIRDYTHQDLNEAHRFFSDKHIYEIDNKSGNIFIVEWVDNDYEHVKQISNREELFKP